MIPPIFTQIYMDIRDISEIWSFAAVIHFTQTSYDNNKFNKILDTNPDAVYYLEEK